jgi:hypothetical protein
MVLHHGSDRRMDHHGCTQTAQTPAAVIVPLEQSQGCGSGQQPLSAILGHGEPACQRCGVERACRQQVEEL